jgi:hypothetical protein
VSEIAVDFLLGPGLLSRAIAWYGNGYGGYSHAAGVMADGIHYLDSRSDIINDVPAGVQLRKIASERAVKRTRCVISCPLAEYQAWEDEGRRMIGDPYGTTDIWAFITGREEHTRGQWICSATQHRLLRRIGYLRKLSIPDHQVTPNSLLLVMEQAGFKTYSMPPIT